MRRPRASIELVLLDFLRQPRDDLVQGRGLGPDRVAPLNCDKPLASVNLEGAAPIRKLIDHENV
jgi:hypothetical protein